VAWELSLRGQNWREKGEAYDFGEHCEFELDGSACCERGYVFFRALKEKHVMRWIEMFIYLIMAALK